MTFQEKNGSLFDLPNDYILVHCISSDFVMGAGIASVFNHQYGIKEAVMNKYRIYNWIGHGYNLMVSSPQCPWTVANLVTKCRCFGKPTYRTLEEALRDLKTQLRNYPDITKIGMPRIGCGLDRLSWYKVSQIIQDVFDDTDYEITVMNINLSN